MTRCYQFLNGNYIMSHELEIDELGNASMAYAGDTPWHGLGTRVLPDLAPEAMLKAANLDWRVEKHPLFAELNGKRIRTEAHALVRDSDQKILSVVTDSWNPVQNSEAFEFFSEFVHAGDMEMHTAGSLKGGKQVWALAKVKDSFFDLFGGDRVESYLLFSNPHQFGKGITVQFTPIRVVCNNTLTLSLNSHSSNMFRMSHNQVFNPEVVKNTLGIATDKLAKYKEMATFLGEKKFNNENIVDYFNRIFPLTTRSPADATDRVAYLESRAAKNAYDIMETQPGAKFAEGSWWQAFNAVTYMVDHKLGKSDNSRLASAWYGVNKDRKIKALNVAVEMAEAS